jgi:hypothetical protein
MRGLDYRSLVDLGFDLDLREKSFSLQLGAVSTEPVSYQTVLALAERTVPVHEVLGKCFLPRPVMWEDPALERPRHGLESLRDLERLLNEIGDRLLSSSEPCEGVFAAIVERWRDLTHTAVRDLEERLDSETEEDFRRILADYRQAAYAPVSALLQILPADDEWATEGREKFDRAKATLGRFLGVDPDEIEEAGWHETETRQTAEEPEVITWGIP